MTDSLLPVGRDCDCGHPLVWLSTPSPTTNPQRSRLDSQRNSHGCASSDPQATARTIEHMNDDDDLPVNLQFNMPASWEDMERLGLDPLTGEPV